MDQHDTFDILVIGGGINGCGIARDMIGRGYSVMLAEKVDFASGTSSWSTKLIHGGLRYLEHYEFRLVREALIEREVLWAMAPHIIRPLRFVLPHHEGLRPTWMLRLGLFAYDHLGGRKLLPPTRTLDLAHDEAGAPLKPEFVKGFEYSDCWVDDARFVVLNARDAADRGAVIRTRTEVTEARPDGDAWRVTLRGADGATRELRARCLVNAAGPWVDHVLGETFGRNDAHNVRLVQGSHIVVKKLYDHDKAYIFQNADGRIIFAIPYEGAFTLIGTTDRDFEGDPRDAKITDEEVGYLVEAASEYFRTPVEREDIVWTYSGVRPLFDDGASKAQEATRDYVLRTEGGHGKPALLNVFGGKLTTYRRLAESAAERIATMIGAKGGSWTARAPLPGGEMPISVAQSFANRLCSTYPWLDPSLAARLSRLYGVRAQDILRGAESADDLGRSFGAGLTEREVRHLVDTEWAITAEDILWRRTKLGLFVTKDEASALDSYLKDVTGHAAHAA
ncbi:glycerol-3-phosphate dehydrogenase [Acuticoccus sediminis]|uniref:Glycerol-3-phosphate dehydrogenase n=1 Tax=Acuticoccus sediminis TaxID=2184697 RepID=A0A8B2NP95_9HYPH|nr:glycerol-3-phosphate dehydrogenase [Acuticoccus sediminis]RAI00502.1 glycerol-3-phosphate dehydrogenase [Acuticoccus sediminis]